MRLPLGLITYLTAYNNNYLPMNNWSPSNNEDLKAYEEYCEIGAEDLNETKKHPQQDKFDEILKNPCINFRAGLR